MLGTEAAVVAGRRWACSSLSTSASGRASTPELARAQILNALRPGSDETPGFFHHTRLQLGAAVYLSAVLSTVAALPGVDAVASGRRGA